MKLKNFIFYSICVTILLNSSKLKAEEIDQKDIQNDTSIQESKLFDTNLNMELDGNFFDKSELTPLNSTAIVTLNKVERKKEISITKTLKKLLKNYDKRVRPNYFGPPTLVEVTFIVNKILSVDEVAMHFDVDLYLRQSWMDPRLSFDLKEENVKILKLSSDIMDHIWRPDSYFSNEKRSYIHTATVVNRFVRLHPDGKVVTSTRLTLTANCPMQFSLYPMDHQVCYLKMGSYGYSGSDIIYKWTDYNQTEINSKTLPQFVVKGYRKTMNLTEFNYTSNTESYSVIQMDFLFVRSMTYYFTQIYVPSFLVVTISYFGLWIGRENPAPRMSLGVTTVLTMTTIYISTNSKSPPICYVKALDIYLGFCFVGVFATLLVSVSLTYMGKKVKMIKEKKKNEKNDQVKIEINDDSNDPNQKTRRQRLKQWKDKKLGFVVSKSEVIARILFPIIFLSFNLIYWIHYLTASQLKYTYADNYWTFIA